MAIYGVSLVATYVAWDTLVGAGKTGDVANHTLRWVKDGVSAAPANAAAEVDAVNAPGLYKVVLTAAEAQAVAGTLGGKSATAGVVITPLAITFENILAVLGLAVGNTDTQLAALADAIAVVSAKTTNLPPDPADHSIVIAATDAIVAAITALQNLSSAQAQAAAAAALAAYDAPTRADVEDPLLAGGSVVVADGVMTIKDADEVVLAELDAGYEDLGTLTSLTPVP